MCRFPNHSICKSLSLQILQFHLSSAGYFISIFRHCFGHQNTQNEATPRPLQRFFLLAKLLQLLIRLTRKPQPKSKSLAMPIALRHFGTIGIPARSWIRRFSFRFPLPLAFPCHFHSRFHCPIFSGWRMSTHPCKSATAIAMCNVQPATRNSNLHNEQWKLNH